MQVENMLSRPLDFPKPAILSKVVPVLEVYKSADRSYCRKEEPIRIDEKNCNPINT